MVLPCPFARQLRRHCTSLDTLHTSAHKSRYTSHSSANFTVAGRHWGRRRERLRMISGKLRRKRTGAGALPHAPETLNPKPERDSSLKHQPRDQAAAGDSSNGASPLKSHLQGQVILRGIKKNSAFGLQYKKPGSEQAQSMARVGRHNDDGASPLAEYALRDYKERHGGAHVGSVCPENASAGNVSSENSRWEGTQALKCQRDQVIRAHTHTPITG